MSDELQEKIAKLPSWARDYIRRLEDRVKNTEPEMRRRAQEVADSKLAYQRLKERCDAMEAILTCAARGGHETAQAYVDRIIKEYSSEEDEGQDKWQGLLGICEQLLAVSRKHADGTARFDAAYLDDLRIAVEKHKS